jgi:ATP-dependent Clp protease protease subunit
VWRDGPTLWNEWARAALLERRTVLVDRPLDDGMAGQAASELMLLDAEGDDPITLRIDCEGGSLGAALTLIDVVDLLGVEVHAQCVGRADGPALALLTIADHRAASPHARLRWGTGDADEFHGDASDIATRAAMLERAVDQLVQRVVAATGLEAGAVRDSIARRSVLGVDDALAAGVLDEVLAPHARVVGFPRRVGFERDR